MVAYSFKTRFVSLVEQGIKTQTIRAPRRRHARPGEAVQLYTGMRTKKCRKLVEPDPVCVDVTPIVITLDEVRVGDCSLSIDECEALAIADGFESHSEMLHWFEQVHGLPFIGILIRWQVAEREIANE